VGTIQSINGSTLTIAGRNGQAVQVVTSASTRVTKVSTSSVSDIAKGEVVVAFGTSSGTNSMAADRISITSPTGAAAPNGAASGTPGRRPLGTGAIAGTVTSVGNGTLTVSEADGTAITVTTSAATTVTKTVDSSVADLATGQSVVVRGTTNADGSVNAAQIQEGGTGFGPFGAGQGPRAGVGGQPASPGAAPGNA
jgi:hypothetical protein